MKKKSQHNLVVNNKSIDPPLSALNKIHNTEENFDHPKNENNGPFNEIDENLYSNNYRELDYYELRTYKIKNIFLQNISNTDLKKFFAIECNFEY